MGFSRTAVVRWESCGSIAESLACGAVASFPARGVRCPGTSSRETWTFAEGAILPAYVTTFLLLLGLGVLIARLVSPWRSGRSPQPPAGLQDPASESSSTEDPESESSSTEDLAPSRELPVMAPWSRRFHRWFNFCRLEVYEFLDRPNEENSTLDIDFFTPRRLLEIELIFGSDETLHIEDVRTGQGEAQTSVPFGMKQGRRLDRRWIRIELTGQQKLTTVSLKLGSRVEAVHYEMQILTVARDDKGSALLRDAIAHLGAGRLDRARGRLSDYERYTQRNPHALHAMGFLRLHEGDYESAEELAMRSALLGLGNAGLELFRAARSKRELQTPLEDIRALEADARTWNLAGHVGAVALKTETQFVLDLGPGHLKRCRNLVQIRRQAAARMMRQVRFEYTENREILLFSALRIIHSNDEIDDIPSHHFTTSDAESRNIFITTENVVTGSWILPDLEAGDIIEWSYDLLCRDRLVEGKSHPFILVGLTHRFLPTSEAWVQFVAPPDYPLAIASRNTTSEGTITRDASGQRVRHTYTQHRCMPVKNTAFPFEHTHLNPILACARRVPDWGSIARHGREILLGQSPAEDPLPPVLARTLQEADGTTDALQKAFYWIRDRVKYGAFAAGDKRIGQKQRAEAIVTSGVGDCKDKTYLLSLVCQELGIPHQILSISAEHALTVAELPAFQHDHVFLRARPDGQWLYLDAASPINTFGNPPAWCQGMQTLLLDETGTLITVPEDRPEDNVVSITERIDGESDGWLMDAVEIRLSGHDARQFDEHWKSHSLVLSDPVQATQEAFRNLLPTVIVSNFERIHDTSGTDSCRATAGGRRCPLIRVGSGFIATLNWRIPALPLDIWRFLELSRLFVFQYPTTVRLALTIGGDLRRRLRDRSGLRSLESEICSIREDVAEDVETVSLTRTIILRRKHIRGKQVGDLPRVFERLEECLRLVLFFSP